MHVKGRRRTYKVLTERPQLVHRLKPRCFLLWGVSINRCTTMPAFTGSVNPKLSYKSLVNMGQKARKHWAHAFMWMLLWFHPLKMLLQTRQNHLTMATSLPSGSNHWGGGDFRSFQNWRAVLRAGSREQSTVHCKVQIQKSSQASGSRWVLCVCRDSVGLWMDSSEVFGKADLGHLAQMALILIW